MYPPSRRFAPPQDDGVLRREVLCERILHRPCGGAAHKGITVTAVCPAPMRTEFLEAGNIAGNSRMFERLPYCDQVQVAGGAPAARAGRVIYTPKLFYKFYRVLAKVTPVKLMVKFTKT